MNKIFIIIPIHNKEQSLGSCIKSLNKSAQETKYCFNTFLILNDCSDKSFEIAIKSRQKYPFLNIKILESARGKLNAQEAAIRKIRLNAPILFVDADVVLKKDSIKILTDELEKYPRLIAVGSFPIARHYKGNNLWKSFLDRVLNIRSRHPMSEISLLNVEEYHSYTIYNPQNKNTSFSHELKSKIFFHGRTFLLRSKNYWSKPKNEEIVGDDSYIPDYIIFNYGKDRIRNRYDSVVYYTPFVSLIEHFNAYKRIYFDLKNLRETYPEFRDIRNHSQLILDKSYIKKQKFTTRFFFLLYSLIRKIERFLFRFSINQNPAKIWK
jgi:glycosyltransferase involved in cell wall biosynthesis